MYEKNKTGNRLSFYKRIIAVIVMTVLLYSSVPMRVFSSVYTATIGTNIPRVSFYYDDNELDVQYCTTINGTYTPIDSGFTLDSNVASLYFKISGTAYTDVLRDGIAISKDTNDIYTINNITSNISITIGTVVNLNVSHGSIVIGKAGSGGRQYTYSDSNGAITGTHNTGNIYSITGTTGYTTDGGGNSITLTGAGDFNIILSNVEIYTGSPGVEYVGKGLCAPISTNGVTGSGNINITIVGSNTLVNVSGNPSDSFAALEKTYTDSTLFINGNGILNTIGGADSAGIGSSNNITNEYRCGTKNIIINNGTINATTIASQGAGIGSGDNCSAHNIRIYGGDITATGINNASGIGGSGSVNFVGASGEVYIYGGTINATSNGTGSGIGGGGSGTSSDAVGGVGTVYIYGGTITTNSIGGGSGGSHGGEATVNIYGGIVTVTSSIGGGNSENGTGGSVTVTITGGTVVAPYITGGFSGATGTYNDATVSIAGASVNIGNRSNINSVTGPDPFTGMAAVVYSQTINVSNLYGFSGNYNEVNVQSAKLSDGNTYPLTDVYTDEDGDVYFWLPTEYSVTNLTINGSEYDVIDISQPQIATITHDSSTYGSILGAALNYGTATDWQWEKSDDGSTWVPILNATFSTYVIDSGDINVSQFIHVVITTTTGSITSGSLRVSATPYAKINYTTLNPGSTLTATLLNPGDGITYQYQWQCYINNVWTNIASATATSYVTGDSDNDKQIRVLISGGSNSYASTNVVIHNIVFIVTIPESITPSSTTGSFDITGNRSYFVPSQSITITCSGDFEMELTGATNITLGYALYEDSGRTIEISSGNEVAAFEGNGISTVPLYYNIDDAPVYAGTYTDTLTFTVTFNSP